MSNLDWKNLPFGYVKTDFNLRAYYKDGKWSSLSVSDSENIEMNIASTCIHYGQQVFEGLKAFMGKDGKIRVFRMDENSKRMSYSAVEMKMPEFPKDLFYEAVNKVVELNKRFVPPYGTGASLYLRPLLIGVGPQVGVKPAREFMFLIFATPVGPYFKNGFSPVKIQIARDFDRAAPKGTGSLKVGGNYASGLRATERAHEEGYASVIFIDAKEKKYIDECGPANFFAIKGNKYITPKSESILASITNKSLMQLAIDLGMEVEQRPIAVEELANFDEVGACGTAACITPIKSIFDRDLNKEYSFCDDGNPGKVSKKLYELLTGIQYGDVADTHNWNTVIE